VAFGEETPRPPELDELLSPLRVDGVDLARRALLGRDLLHVHETALLETFMGVPDTPENRAKFIATIPLGRMSQPEDIAKACVYLASDDADFITGVVLPVDGGRTI